MVERGKYFVFCEFCESCFLSIKCSEETVEWILWPYLKGKWIKKYPELTGTSDYTNSTYKSCVLHQISLADHHFLNRIHAHNIHVTNKQGCKISISGLVINEMFFCGRLNMEDGAEQTIWYFVEAPNITSTKNKEETSHLKPCVDYNTFKIPEPLHCSHYYYSFFFCLVDMVH